MEITVLDADRRAAWRALLVAHAGLMRRLERLHADHGLMPLEWYDVLVHLAEAPQERLRLSALADAVLLSRSGLTRLVTRMVEVGWVRREVCPSDRRGAYAVLTEAGRRALEAAAPTHLAGIQEFFGDRLTPMEAGQLYGILTRFR